MLTGCCACKCIFQVLLRDAECFGMIDAALQTSGLCETSAPPRPTLRYGMETTDLLLCLSGVNEEGVPARRGGLADLCFCFAPHDRKTYYVPSPLRGCGGTGQVTAGAVTKDNNIVVAIEAEDQHRMRRVDIYRFVFSYISEIHILFGDTAFKTRSKLPVCVLGMITRRSAAGWRCALQHTGTCML